MDEQNGNSAAGEHLSESADGLLSSAAEGAGEGAAGNESANAAPAPGGDGKPGNESGTGQEAQPEATEKTREGDGKEAEGGEDAKAELDKAWEGFGDLLDKNAGLDPAIVEEFVRQAKDLSLTPDTAKALVDWQLEATQRQAAHMRETGLASLKKDWGLQLEPRLRQTQELITNVDRQFPSCEFSASLKRFGILNDENFVRGLHYLASQLAEDSLAAPHGPASGNVRPESPLEGVRNAYKNRAR